jgi:hypothetical protein
MLGTSETVETGVSERNVSLRVRIFFSNISGFYSVKMESDSEDLILLNPFNVGCLHPDCPMDASAGAL